LTFREQLPSFIRKVESLWKKTISGVNSQFQSDLLTNQIKQTVTRQVFDHLELICLSPFPSIGSMITELDLFMEKPLLDFLPDLKMDVTAMK
jgi:hypothetical protein